MTRKNPDRTAIKERLRPGEEHFRTLVDHAPDGIFIADAHGRYLEVNAAWCEMLGYSHDEILGMMVSDVLAPDEAPRVAGEVARLRDGDVVKSVWRFRRKDDSIFYGEVNGRRLADSRLLGYVRDISQHRQVEDHLRASQRFIEAVAKASPPIIYVFDLDEERLRYLNRSILGELGHPEPMLEATDGPTALLMSADCETIDLLVSDVVMPEMSGRRLADALLSRRPQCRVLFMSGYNEEMLADRTASGPTEAFIQKPFTPVTLARKVREILDRRA